jgi:hypothetical protein
MYVQERNDPPLKRRAATCQTIASGPRQMTEPSPPQSASSGQPTSKIGALRELLFDLLQEHNADGTIPTNARFLFYELVQRGQLSKEKTGARRPDQNLHDALTDIREDGRIPWDWIVDETRSLDDYTGYASIKDGVLAQLPYITLDPWRSRSPMHLTESRSLAGVLRNVVVEYRASRRRTVSVADSCAPISRRCCAPGDRVIYFGDLDLFGGHIEDNTRRVFEREIGGALRWERLALTKERAPIQPADHHQARPPLPGRPPASSSRDGSDQPTRADRHPAHAARRIAARAACARSSTRGAPAAADRRAAQTSQTVERRK